jgi:hypothetical protein
MVATTPKPGSHMSDKRGIRPERGCVDRMSCERHLRLEVYQDERVVFGEIRPLAGVGVALGMGRSHGLGCSNPSNMPTPSQDDGQLVPKMIPARGASNP